MRKIAGLLLCLLLLCACAAADADIHVGVDVTYDYATARKVADLVNAFRHEEGVWYWNADNETKTYPENLPDLIYDENLEKVAMRRAAELAVYYDHTRPDGTVCFDIYPSSNALAENIAMRQTSAQEVFTAWREENDGYGGQGHRRNMLSTSVTRIGVGCVKAGGWYFWCQAFSGTIYSMPEITLGSPIRVDASMDLLTLSNAAATAESLRVNQGETAPNPQITATSGSWCPIILLDPTWTAGSEILSVSSDGIMGLAGGNTAITWDDVSVPVRVLCAEHAWGEPETLQAATCVAPGKALLTCAVCAETMETEIPIDQNAHDWAEPTYAWDENHENVTAARICNRLGSHTETETVRAFGEMTLAPACETRGETTYTSEAFQNAAFKVQTVTEPDLEPLGHEMVVDPAVEATYTAPGLTEGSHCSRCSKIFVAQEVIPQKVLLASVKFKKEKVTAKQEVTITVMTSLNAEKLTMYSGTRELASWTKGYEDKQDVRTWKVTYAFPSAGEKKVTFTAVDGIGTASDQIDAEITVTKEPKVSGVKFSRTKPTVNQKVTITIKTSVTVSKLTMSSGGKELKFWTNGYTDKNGIRTWKVTYTFTGTGSKTVAFRGTDENKVTSEALKTGITITKPPAVSSVKFDKAKVKSRQKASITIKTNTVATKLIMYVGGKPVKTLTNGYTDKSGVRTWKISYTFTGTGKKSVIFKAKDANGIASAAKKAAIEVVK